MPLIIRWPIVSFLRLIGRFSRLSRRAHFTEIGFSGYVSDSDRNLAAEQKVQPLNRFEKWLLRPYIEAAQKARRRAYRQACIEVTGEDPEVDYA